MGIVQTRPNCMQCGRPKGRAQLNNVLPGDRWPNESSAVENRRSGRWVGWKAHGDRDAEEFPGANIAYHHLFATRRQLCHLKPSGEQEPERMRRLPLPEERLVSRSINEPCRVENRLNLSLAGAREDWEFREARHVDYSHSRSIPSCRVRWR